MGRFALLIGTGRYDDAALRPLSAPEWDVDALGEVLADPAVGGFEVTRLMDRPVQELRVAVEDFLTDRAAGDFVLVYLSCHGVLDKRGRLAFASTDTGATRLSATALSAGWLGELLADCVAAGRVLVLDCCFSGAHDRAKAGTDAVAAQLGEVGSGHAVLTASRDWEFSFEGDPSGGSVFTAGLVEGLRTGAADLDRDGLISVEEAYTYAADYVRDQGATQHSQRWVTAAEGHLVLARSPLGPRPVPRSARQASLDRRAEREVAVCVGHSRRITHLVWSPDGRCLASSSQDETVRLWDGMTGECLVELDGSLSVRNLAWSEDASRLILVSRDNKVVTWVLPERLDDVLSSIGEERALTDEEKMRYGVVI